ncbi:uncharacterized protein LOC110745480 isoform X2 [Prunus avium]|uniref:Defective in cullin neddylation protein n=1 Tax=Prunus avium TaxID=42229 RepID=A0A6P5RH83_PRUAV|nr:uncharacterized protein LOC110745480 isoform X2 [Prunus avium]
MATYCTRSERTLTRMSLRRTKIPFQGQPNHIDVRTVNGYGHGDDYRGNNESQMTKYSREALIQLLNLVQLKLHPRISIFDEVFKLMSRLDLVVDFSEFSRFYDFVFFMCHENAVNKAITAWRLVLAGRFRLLNQWCDFVEAICSFFWQSANFAPDFELSISELATLDMCQKSGILSQ